MRSKEFEVGKMLFFDNSEKSVLQIKNQKPKNQNPWIKELEVTNLKDRRGGKNIESLKVGKGRGNDAIII